MLMVHPDHNSPSFALSQLFLGRPHPHLGLFLFGLLVQPLDFPVFSHLPVSFCSDGLCCLMLFVLMCLAVKSEYTDDDAGLWNLHVFLALHQDLNFHPTISSGFHWPSPTCLYHLFLDYLELRGSSPS